MKYEGKIEVKNILAYLGRFIGNKVQELNNNNFDEFVNSRAHIPKILLFTNKKNIPLIFKRLSLEFDVSIFIIYNIFFYYFRKKSTLVLFVQKILV